MDNFMNLLLGPGGIERTINGFVWGLPGMALILGIGLWLTIRCGAPQFTRIGHIFKNTAGKALGRSEKPEKAGTVSPFQAMCTALAASIGTGNIAGVSGAIALGGPGAVFWMWISALVGMCTKFSEVTLAVHFREKNAFGEWVGGPMYYIRNGLSKNWGWLAVLFSLLGGIACFGVGNMTQINTIAGTINQAVSSFVNTTESQQATIALITGIICAVIVFIILVGGVQRIADVCTLMVPTMALLYVVASLIIIVFNLNEIPSAFRAIFVGAFHPAAISGGLVGVSIKQVVSHGVGRGIFSNEAGLGSAPIAHAASDVDHPVAQGIYGVFEVFMDTIVVCTMTAMVVLLGVGVNNITFGTDTGAALTINGFQSVFGSSFPAVIVAICLTLFALSTVLAWGLYGSRCIEFLLGEKAIKPFRIFFSLFAVVGATMKLDTVWNISNTLNGLMMIPNLIALLLLSPVVIKLSKEYFSKVDAKKKR